MVVICDLLFSCSCLFFLVPYALVCLPCLCACAICLNALCACASGQLAMVASLACQLRSRRARPLARIVLCPGVSCVPFALAPTCWLVWAVRWGGDQFDGMNSVVLLSLSLAVLASGAGVRAALVARNVWSFFFPFFSLLLFFFVPLVLAFRACVLPLWLPFLWPVLLRTEFFTFDGIEHDAQRRRLHDKSLEKIYTYTAEYVSKVGKHPISSHALVV